MRVEPSGTGPRGHRGDHAGPGPPDHLRPDRRGDSRATRPTSTAVTGDSRAFNWGAGTSRQPGSRYEWSGHPRGPPRTEETRRAPRAADSLEVAPADLRSRAARAPPRARRPGSGADPRALAAAAPNPIRYAYAREASEAAPRRVSRARSRVLATGEEPGLEATGYHALPQAALPPAFSSMTAWQPLANAACGGAW